MWWEAERLDHGDAGAAPETPRPTPRIFVKNALRESFGGPAPDLPRPAQSPQSTLDP